MRTGVMRRRTTGRLTGSPVFADGFAKCDVISGIHIAPTKQLEDQDFLA